MTLRSALPAPVPLTRLAEAVIPIYLPDDDADSRKPEIAGSGVLVEVGGQPFLLTAAHVLDENEEGRASFYISQDGGIGDALECPAWKTPVPAGLERDDDPIDVGILQLTGEMLEKTARQPLMLAELDRSHRFGGSNEYGFFGYPDSQTKARPGLRKVVSKDFLLIARSVAHARYTALNPRGDLPITPDTHLVAHVDPDRIVTDDDPTPRRMVDPHGISGGGIFRLTKNRQAGCLVGIVLGRDPKTDLFMGGHVRTWLTLLARTCQEVAQALRVSGP
ncbi:MAG TPA: hypothetical protein PLL76_19890 [Thermoanaerobaculia bacterium]|jgi:hypothetical protein|nr:hypothetical protein [Thermoanaerobaculia bacterium]